MKKLWFISLAIVLTAKGAFAGAGSNGGGSRFDSNEAKGALASDDAERIKTALGHIRNAGREGVGRPVILALVNRLKEGLPKAILVQALKTLADLDDDAGLPAAQMYVVHRDVDVRLSALKCMTAAKGANRKAAIKALRDGLGDSDTKVRNAAATLLGSTKASEVVPDLFEALEKGVSAAAVSIGQLCDAKQCDTLLDSLKSKPFDIVTSGLQQVLVRKDVSEESKRKVLQAVRGLESAKAREFLVEVKQTWPANSPKALTMMLDLYIRELEGAAK